MARKTEEVEAIFIRERQRWGETTITTCVKNEDAAEYAKRESSGRFTSFDRVERDDEFEQTIKLDCDEGELEPGITYRFFGSWVKHWRYGDQFHCKTFTKITPHDKTGVINYLMKAPGIGKGRAEQLWQAYHGNAVRTLRETPLECAHLFPGGRNKPPAIKLREKLEEAAAYLEQEKDLEDATIDVVSLLAGRGFPKKLAREAIATFGNLAAEKIRKNPYKLMRFKGVGFLRADAMYLDLGGNPAKLKRQALAIWHGIESNSDGHTWFGVDFIRSTLREKIAGADSSPLKAIRLCLRSGLLQVYKDPWKAPWFCTRRMAEDEADIARGLAFLSTRDSAWPSMLATDLSDHQQEQLEAALSQPVGIFSGDPGSGKSYVAARLVARIAELNGCSDIAVIAPTGKAAVRVTEAMLECGVNVRAQTVHSLLRVASNAGGVWTFDHGRDNPIEQRYVIVDECSMLDVPIMASLVRALRTDGHLLLVGDFQQLPPVGHGAPLRDLLAAKVPFGNLTEIRRNSGAIVEACQAIREERSIKLIDRINLDVGNNLAIRRASDQEAASKVESLVRAIRDRKLCEPVWDLQVIVALNDKSDLSRKKLNKALQLELNSSYKTESLFWIHDKIVCLRNQMLPIDDDAMETVDDDLKGMTGETAAGDATAYVANGEIGKVIAVYPNKLVFEFFTPKRIVVCPRAANSDPEGFDLGYAISCHKSQGSQWKVVIVALDPSGGARRVCDRSWIYTSISRAQEVCFLVGRDQTLAQFCRTQKIDNRKTFLADRFGVATKELEDAEGKEEREEQDKRAESKAQSEETKEEGTKG